MKTTAPDLSLNPAEHGKLNRARAGARTEVRESARTAIPLRKAAEASSSPVGERQGGGRHFDRTSRRIQVVAALVLLSLAGNAGARDIYVERCVAAGGDGSLGRPFTTFAAALTAAGSGDIIRPLSDSYADRPLFNKPVRVEPFGGRVIIGVSAPPPCPNFPPVVNAGSDQRFTVVSASAYRACLQGTASDDGRPNGQLTIAWGKESGPGTVTFEAVGSRNTCATFSVAGIYTLRLTASDGALSASDTAVVEFAISQVNRPPSVNAGSDATITGEYVSTAPHFRARRRLVGQVTDDGQPNPPGRFTVAWSQVSGPQPAALTQPEAAETDVLFPVPGDYVFRLSASDGVASAADTVWIRVTERSSVSYLALEEVDSALCGGSFNRRIRIRNSHACAAMSYVVGVTRHCRDGSRAESVYTGTVPAAMVQEVTCKNTYCDFVSMRIISASYGTRCGVTLGAPGLNAEGPLLEITTRDDGATAVTLIGKEGAPHTVEASTDLVNWDVLTNLTVGELTVPIHDPQAPTSSVRFYRAWRQ